MKNAANLCFRLIDGVYGYNSFLYPASVCRTNILVRTGFQDRFLLIRELPDRTKTQPNYSYMHVKSCCIWFSFKIEVSSSNVYVTSFLKFVVNLRNSHTLWGGKANFYIFVYAWNIRVCGLMNFDRHTHIHNTYVRICSLQARHELKMFQDLEYLVKNKKFIIIMFSNTRKYNYGSKDTTFIQKN